MSKNINNNLIKKDDTAKKTNSVLSAKNITKVFNNRVAVNNISFDVHEGEIFGLLGPNGAGKTTTMKMICGLTKITRGEIYVCGSNVSKNKEKALKNIGAIIENPLMYTYMSGYDNLKYYASLYKGISKQDILSYARVVGLEYRLKDKVSTYSLGMRQRLGICQALLHNPKLLILDEPLSGLDPAGVKEIRDFLKFIAKKQKIAILISSHMLGEMEQLCDTIAIINNGKLIETKTLKQLQEGQENSKKIKITVNAPNYAGKIIINELRYKVEIAGNSVVVYANQSEVPKITNKLISYGVSIFGIEYIYKSLEQIFMEIINSINNGSTTIF